MNLADAIREFKMGTFWVVAAIAVAVLSGLLTPWDAISAAKDQGQAILASVAGYTFPLTLGFAVISFLALKGAHEGGHPYVLALAGAVILWLSGEAARMLGLGRVPTYSTVVSAGPLTPLATVLTAYLNVYTWGLMVSSLIIGFGLAVHIERWLHSKNLL